MSGVVKIGHVIVPAADMDAMQQFYAERLGLTVRFRDGDRYAGVTDGAVTLGLAAPEEQPVAARVVVSFEVEDLDGVLAQLAPDVAGEVVDGAHERRVVVRDPAGNPICLYERRPQ